MSTHWSAAAPPMDGTFDTAANELHHYVERGEDLLARLPARPGRTEEQQYAADLVHRACRVARRRFLAAHVERVYDELTAGRRDRLSVEELAYGAAKAFPGLVPTSGQMDEERLHDQPAKEGHEIDQGILFGAVLGSPTAGGHLVDSMRMPTDRAQKLLAEFGRTGVVDLGTVAVRRDGAAAHVTLQNNRCLNAEDEDLVDDLETAVDLVLLDDGVRVGVLRGGVMSHPRYEGRRVFSAGINLTDLYQGQISFLSFLLRRELGLISKIQRGLLTEPDEEPGVGEKPWLAVVDTFAIGGGMQMLLVFDRVIAAADAYFSLPAAREGIVPGVASLRLGRLTGGRLARQVILGGRRIDAGTPDGRLICDDVLDPVAVDGAVEAATDELARPAVRVNRRMLNLAEEPPEAFQRYLSAFAVEQAYRLYSKDVLDTLARAWLRRRRR